MNANDLYVIRAAWWRRAIVGLVTISYIAFSVVRFCCYNDATNEVGTIAVISLTIWSALAVWLTETRFTHDGVQHRAWYGRKRFSPYEEISVLEKEGKSVLIHLHG